MDLFILSSSIAYLLFVWFHTDGIIEWARLFNLNYLFKISDYNTWKLFIKEENFRYVDFLRDVYKESFIIKLITCPICICFWASLFSCFFYSINLCLSIAFMSLLEYFILVLIYTKIDWNKA